MRFTKIHGALIAIAAVGALALPQPGLARHTVDSVSMTDPEITVRVENNNWADVRVYATTRSGARERLGTVNSFTTARFTLARWVSPSNNEIQLVAFPIGSRETFGTGSIVVSPGEVIVWHIENNSALSTIRVQAGQTEPLERR